MESMMPIEIFSHDLVFHADEDTEGVFILSGKGWENEPFKIYIREDEAKNILWQLNFFVGSEV